jgi:hypothetical protein
MFFTTKSTLIRLEDRQPQNSQLERVESSYFKMKKKFQTRTIQIRIESNIFKLNYQFVKLEKK